MYPSRFSMGPTTAVAVFVCVASLAPALAYQGGGITNPSLQETLCCVAAQTQDLQVSASGPPMAGAIPDSHKAGRAGVPHAIVRMWRAPDSNVSQAPSFTPGRRFLISDGRWITSQTRSPTGRAGRFLTGSTAGDAQVLAYSGLGEAAGQPAQAPAVDRSPRIMRGADCAGTDCAAGIIGTADITLSGTYDLVARAVAARDGGSALAQASQPGASQTDGSQAPAGDDSKQATVDPSAPGNDSAAADEEFSGSTEPAGPDLTVSEEQSAISQGWK